MRTEGNVLGVLRALKEKKHLLASDQLTRSKKLRIGLHSLSGLMRGTTGGGQVAALEAGGYTETFDDLSAASTGLPQISYFSAGQAEVGRRIYWQQCTQGFISWRRGLTPSTFGGGPVTSARFLSNVFRGSLNQKAVRASPSQIHFAMTNAETGKGLYINAKTIQPDIVHGIEAGISVPGLSEGAVTVGGVRMIDGGGGMPFGAREIYERTHCDYLLILANAPGLKIDSMYVKILSKYFLRKLSVGAKEAFMTRHERFNDEYTSWQKNPACEWGIIWSAGEGIVSSYEQDPAKIYAASECARRHLSELIRQS